MKALLYLFAAAAAPALAQHSGHTAQESQPADSGCTAEHAAMGHCTMPAPSQEPPKSDPPPADPHGGHDMSAGQAAARPAPADPHAGHDMTAQPTPVDPHAGHDMSAAAPEPAQPAPADPHAGHDMTAQPTPVDPHAGHDMSAAAPEPAPPPPEALSGPAHAADAVYGAEMARARDVLRREHGRMPAHLFMVERAEAVFRNGRDGFALDAQAWLGGDIDKLWFKGEAEGASGEKLEHAEVQALWSRAIDPWFDFQAGVRYDPRPGPDRAHLVLGVQGLAPHWWEVDGALFLSSKGELTARAEAEYDLRITQEIILQPRIEADLSAQDIRELGTGAGLSELSAGLRLRYQPTPLFAPYVGVEYARAFGRTARFRRAEGEDKDSLNLLAGVRFFF